MSLQLWQNGRSWVLLKRYSQFKAFHAQLEEEYKHLLAEKAALVAAQKKVHHKTDEQLAQLAKFEEMHRKHSVEVQNSLSSGDHHESLLEAARGMGEGEARESTGRDSGGGGSSSGGSGGGMNYSAKNTLTHSAITLSVTLTSTLASALASALASTLTHRRRR